MMTCTLRRACRLLQVFRECMLLNRCKDGTPPIRNTPEGGRPALAVKLCGNASPVGHLQGQNPTLSVQGWHWRDVICETENACVQIPLREEPPEPIPLLGEPVEAKRPAQRPAN